MFIRTQLQVSTVNTFKQCECRANGTQQCGATAKALKTADFGKDINDIIDGTTQVMCICKLNPWEVKRTRAVIERSFRYYEEIRQRVDRVPVKRFNKENFMHDLAVDTGMNRLDSQLAYGIVKRAFKAYYHGTGEGGKRLSSLAQRMRHRSECLWLHAARRTAQVYAAYAGLMYWEMKQYETCIECVYKNLFDLLQSRLVYEDNPMGDCDCEITENKTQMDLVKIISMSSVHTNATTEIFFNKQAFKLSKPTSSMTVQMDFNVIEVSKENTGPSKNAKKRKRRKCQCQNMECVPGQPPPRITAECSQGPYTCRWVSYDEEETFPEHRVPCPPMQDICPICDDLPCDPECTCTCEICTCQPEFDQLAEEEHSEKLSNSGLEDYDTDFCYLAPFRNWPKADIDKTAGTKTDVPEELIDCEQNRRDFPHLFTYLMPLNADRGIPERESEEDVIKTIKPPPVDFATYCCRARQRA